MSSARADAPPIVTTTSLTAGAPTSSSVTLRPVAVLRATILALLVANLGRIPVLSTGQSQAPILFNDIAVALALGACAIAALQWRRLRIDRVGLAALLFAAVGGWSAVAGIVRFGFAGHELLIGLAYLARWLFYFALYVAAINFVRRDDVESVWQTLELTVLLFAAFGIVQSIFLPGFAQMVYPDSRAYADWDPQGHRLVSTVLEPNIAGAIILIVLLVQMARLSTGARTPLWKPVLLLAALVLTLSRSSFLGLLVAAPLILVVRGLSKRMLRLAGVAALVTLAALPKLVTFASAYGKFSTGGSAAARLAAWAMALRIFVDHPLIGVGFNMYGFVQERYFGLVPEGLSGFSTDGGLLFIAVLTGIVGLACYLLMLALVVRRCRTIWRDRTATAATRGLAIGVAAATIGVCVQSFFVNSLLTPFVMEPLWILWALTSVMAARPRRDEDASEAIEAARPTTIIATVAALR